MILNVNGQRHDVDVEDDMPLLWVLRDVLGMTGTKYGCGVSQCGACTVHVDGQARRSCVTPVASVVNAQITTIEGVVARDRNDPVVRAWIDEGVPQCGYCQPGMIMASKALLARIPKPTDEDIDREITNICRCGTYYEIRRAIHRAAGTTTGTR
jgi:isoquinoline 1-oxidoreductase alpha subunit